MRYFPIFLDLAGRRVVIAGGAEAATQKLRLALKTEAEILVVAPDVSADLAGEVAAHARDGRIALARRAFAAADLDGAALVYAATGDADTDAAIAAAARAAGVPVNAVDRPEISDFITPAIVDRDPVTVAIGTEGAAPVLARAIKSRIEAMLPAATGPLARLAASWRGRIATRLPDGRTRRRVWQRFFAGDLPGGDGRSALAAAELRLEALIGAAERLPEAAGRVSLVGAGPGDPELLTLKARRRLHEADVVVYDRLADPRILELARREARLVAVGKVPGGPSVGQDRINAILVEEAGRGHDVVRLKGGDPLVFGRADEELAALRAAGIEAEIVPGITAASAAAASAGVSLTRRGRNTAFSVVTAHDADGAAALDWRHLARSDAAFAIYMGVGGAGFVEGRLLSHGADPSTPVILVENASRPDERILATSLCDLSGTVRREEVRGPAIIFVGIEGGHHGGCVDVGPALAQAAIRRDPALAMGGL
jgi:uroporphyrin-III C-methyltransferase/precorrin-2 dehydrogenase/sirohydrochlorin ferrochelatase